MTHFKATPERLTTFSDGVFAVLITILVLDLRPPQFPTFDALLSLRPTWLSYAVSYGFVAIVWAAGGVKPFASWLTAIRRVRAGAR